jgi:hypothetical protein
MANAFIMLLLVVYTGGLQTGSDACCKCKSPGSAGQSSDVICLSAKEMRKHVDHVESLQPSGLGKGLNLSGILVLEVRFEADGKVACSRAVSGHPIAISAAMEAIPKWIFKPLVRNGVAKAGCGHITIKYRLRDRGSSTELK